MNLTWLYVGALYAAAVYLTRRGGVDLPRRTAFLFYALVLLFFFKPLTQDYVNVPADFVRRLPPWAHLDSRPPLNHEMNDVTVQHAVWAHQVRESWKAFDPPLWNHLSGSGYPLLANGQSSALSPIRLLALPLSLGHAMTAEGAFKILIALTFTYLFCRRRGYSNLAGIAGAIAFGFGGFTTMWLHFPHIAAACFLPAVLYFIDVLADGWSFGAFVAAAVTWTAIVFGGHPETASHIFFLALLYILWIIAAERRTTWRLTLTLGGALTVAALLAAPFLLPFAEAVTKSQRYDWLKATPFSAEDLPWKDWQSAVAFVQPHAWGRVPSEPNWGWSAPEPMSGFAGTFALASWFATIVSVARRRAWRSTEMFFALSTLLVVGVIFAWPVIGEGIHMILPLVAHARFRLLFVLLAAVQSAFIFDEVLRGERKSLFAGLAVACGMIVAALLAVPFPDDAKLRSALLAAIPTAAVIVAAVVFAAARTRRWALVILIAAITAEIFSITRGWSPPLRADEMYPATSLIARLEQLKRSTPPNEPFRIAGIDAQLFPNTSAMYGLEDVRAHDPMAHARYLGFLRLTAGYDPWEYFARLRNPEASVLDFLNVRYVLIDPQRPLPDPARYNVVYDGRDGRILENRNVLPRFFAVRNVIVEFRDEVFFPQLAHHRDWRWTAILDELKLETEAMRGDFFNPRPVEAPVAEVKIVAAESADFRLKADAPRWSLVASSIPWWPGWKVERNGKRIDPIRVNGIFLGFAVPPGDSDIRVWYSPWTWWIGVWLATTTAVALLAFGIRQRTRA
jgi:hypothetical protein